MPELVKTYRWGKKLCASPIVRFPPGKQIVLTGKRTDEYFYFFAA